MNRCGWAKDDLSIGYHDLEWGVPVHNSTQLVRVSRLGRRPAGLSWEPQSFGSGRRITGELSLDFDPAVIARFNAAKIEKLLGDPGIVGNRLKVSSGHSQCPGRS